MKLAWLISTLTMGGSESWRRLMRPRGLSAVRFIQPSPKHHAWAKSRLLRTGMAHYSCWRAGTSLAQSRKCPAKSRHLCVRRNSQSFLREV